MWKQTIILLALLLLALNIFSARAPIKNQSPITFRITKVNCEVFDKSWVRINVCECRPIRRGVSVINLNVTLLKPTYNIYMNLRFAKKDGWYKPYLYNITFDGCDYLKKRNNPIVNIIYDHFKNVSNINHTCPYKGDQIIKGFYVDLKMLKQLPIVNGEYAVYFTWIYNGSKAYTTNIFAEYNKYDSD